MRLEMFYNKSILNFLVIISLSTCTFAWTSFIFKMSFEWHVLIVIIICRILASLFLFRDYSLSWSKATQKTFLFKCIIVAVPLCIYVPIFYTQVYIVFMISEAINYLVAMTFVMYSYFYYVVRNDSQSFLHY